MRDTSPEEEKSQCDVAPKKCPLENAKNGLLFTKKATHSAVLWHSIIKVSIWKCEKWTSIHETSHCDQHVKHRNCWKKWRGEEKKFGHLKKLHLEAKNSDLENEFLNEKKKNLVNQFLMKSEINFVVWHSLKYIDVCQKKNSSKGGGMSYKKNVASSWFPNQLLNSTALDLGTEARTLLCLHLYDITGPELK